MSAAPARKPQPETVSAFAIIAMGSGPERKYQAVRLTIVGETVTARVVLVTTRWRDLAEDAARRALWGKG